MKRVGFRWIRHFAFTFGLGAAVTAGAQTAPPPVTEPAASTAAAPADVSDADDLATVVVTARRIEEKAQDVPISMTIFNQQQLTDKNVSTGVDLATYTPSLTANSEFGVDNTSFAIRGFHQEIGTTASVAVYFADVVAPRGGAGGVNTGDGAGPGAFFDLQNVQVLKGPQGTLFGRNTDGGALLLVPQRPTSELSGFVDAGYGNYNQWSTQGVFNAPVTSNLRVRFGFDHEDQEGYMTNISGVGPTKFNDKGYNAARASAVWNITPNLENYTVASYVHSSHAGTAEKVFACNPESSLGSLFACDQIDRQAGRGFWTTQNDLPIAHTTLNQWQVVNNTAWTATDNLTVRNIASYAQLSNTIYSDLFGTNFLMPDLLPYSATKNVHDPFAGDPLFFTNVVTAPGHKLNDESTTTEELRAEGNAFNNRLTYQGGAYAEFNEPIQDAGITSGTTISCTNILALQCFDLLGTLAAAESIGSSTGTKPGDVGTVNDQVGSVRHRDLGVYEQSTYAITDKLKFTEGLRYTMDASEANYRLGVYHFPRTDDPMLYCLYSSSPYAYHSGKGVSSTTAPSLDSCAISLKQNSYAPTWTTGLDYKPTANELLFGKYSRGYRQGSVQPTGPEGVNSFKPEKVESFEIGSKTSFDRFIRGTFDLDAFYNNFRDQQLSEGFNCPPNDNCGAQPNQGIVNAGRSRIWGLEAESTLLPFKGLALNVSYAYINSKLISITQVPLPAGSPYAPPSPTVDVGDELPLTPKNKISSTATYVLPLASKLGRISGSLGYTYQSGQIQSSKLSTPYYKTAGYGITNMNLDWKAIYGSQFDVGFFATNLFDQRYVIYSAGVYDATGFESEQLGDPRMYGGHIRLSFGR